MGLKRETYYQLYERFRDKMLISAPIGQLVRGGKARTFIEIVASEFGTFYDNILYDITQHFLKFATGDMLEVIGDIFGVSRIQSSPADTTVDEKCLKFYTTTGVTFGEINNGLSIVIPGDTKVRSIGGLEYRLNGAVVLDAAATEAYGEATAINAGRSGNAESNSLVMLDFAAYANSSQGTLAVTNVYSIGNGVDVESDTNYRYRISLRLRELERCNITALYAGILAIPGVRDVRFERYADGLGTMRVYLYGVYPDQSDRLIQQAQYVANEYSAVGDYIQVVAPDNIGITVRAGLVFKSSINSALATKTAPTTRQKDTMVTAAVEAVENYFEALEIDDPFVPEQVIAAIINSDPGILDIGEADSTFDYILLTRTLPNGSKSSRYITGNYYPKTGELITLDTADIYYE